MGHPGADAHDGASVRLTEGVATPVRIRHGTRLLFGGQSSRAVDSNESLL